MSTINYLEELLKKFSSNQSNQRIDWDRYFMSIAILGSVRSSCHKLKVGCVLVKNNRLVSMGYNGFLPKSIHVSRIRDNHEQSTVHAEQNAISDAASRGVSVNECTAYVTHYPCINCFKILLASGITNIIYLEDYKNDNLIEELLNDVNSDSLKVKISKLNYLDL